MSLETIKKVYIASDHAGFELKEKLKNYFTEYEWVDLGPENGERVDYPDYADRVAKKIGTSPANVGVLICGSGQGMAMRANRFLEARAALVWNEESTRLAREHNNANIICLGARLLSASLAIKLVQIFLTTPFEEGRHANRVSKLNARIDSKC